MAGLLIAIIAVIALLGCDSVTPLRGAPGRAAASAPGAASSGAPSAKAAGTGGAQAVAAAAGSSVPAVASSAVGPPPPVLAGGGARAVRSAHGVVSSEDADATRAGVAVLGAGGNAIDAAVAVGYALSVTNLTAGGLGGGGFMLVRLADGQSFAIDYREVAPARATVALNDKQLHAGAHGYLSAPVPGVVAGLNLARERFGSKPLGELMAPAISLADAGFNLSLRQATVLAWFWKRVRRDPIIRALLGRGRGRAAPAGRGARIKRPALAATLRAVAEHGNDGFYRGEVAAHLVSAAKRHGGVLAESDLVGYRARTRQPLRFSYRGLEVLTMPPPSMGGIALASILLGLEQLRAYQAPRDSALSLHLFIEAARRAYADRRAVGADPDFIDAAVAEPLRRQLLDRRYYAERRPPISREHATPSEDITPIQDLPAVRAESPDTTHFSVVDGQGNAVACTTTLSAAYGAWVMVPDTGVMLSNAMGAFSPDGANTLAPGKRMASSMTPTLLVRRGKTVAVVGSPGGDTIPATVAQVIRNLVDYQLPLDQAVEAGRIHHQYKPDRVRLEKRRPPSPAVRAALERMGHTLELNPIPMGDVNAIVIDPAQGVAWGYADSRKGGLALAPAAPR